MEVILLFPHILFASLYIFGFWNLFNPGMMLHKLDLYLEPRLGWLYSPLIGCSICMASCHGTAYYFLMVGSDPAQWVFFCFALSGFNYFVAENFIK